MRKTHRTLILLLTLTLTLSLALLPAAAHAQDEDGGVPDIPDIVPYESDFPDDEDIVILVPPTAPPAVGLEDLPFADVTGADWFFDDVAAVYDLGLMQGVSDTLFLPRGMVTRGMAITVLGRYDGVDEALYPDCGFADVKSGMYYTPFAEWARTVGLADGGGAETFRPEAPITRQDLAVLFLRYIDYIELPYIVTFEYRSFPDEGDISDYAKSAVQYLNKLDILRGRTDGRIDPKGHATRAELAAMLNRLVAAVEFWREEAPLEAEGT